MRSIEPTTMSHVERGSLRLHTATPCITNTRAGMGIMAEVFLCHLILPGYIHPHTKGK